MIWLMLLALSAWPVLAQTYTIGQTVILERDGQRVERLVVGQPDSKVLAEDSDFTKRMAAQWQFVSRYENVRAWMRGEQPEPGPMAAADLDATNIVLRMTWRGYYAAPVLGDSLYYLHAVPRTEMVDGQEVTHEDSREWGPIHHREIIDE